VSLLVNQATPTLTWAGPADMVYGAPLGAAQLDATADVTGSFAYSPAPGTVLGAGGHALSVTFTPTDTADYTTASRTADVNVLPAMLTISPAVGQSKAYGANLPALSYAPTGFVNGDTTALLGGALGTTATTASPVGAYAFTLGSLSAGPNYTLVLAASPPAFAVTPASLTISPAAGQSKAYGANLPALSYAPTGFVNGDTAALLGGALGTTATTASAVGTYAFTLGSLSAGGNYTLALADSAPTFDVTPASLTVTPGAGQSKVYGANLPALGYAPSGFVNGDGASVLTGALGTTATVSSPVGSYAYTLGSLAAGGNYTLVLAASPPTFAVTPATLTVTAKSATRAYGAANPAFTFSYNGFVNGDGVGVVHGSPVLSSPAKASSAPGKYAIAADVSALSAANYIFQAVPGTLTVTPAPLSAAAVNISATAGIAFSGTVATFHNADPFGGASSYLAVIYWGDGTSSAGVISGSGATLSVSGTHTYCGPLTTTFRVQISHRLGYTTAATAYATASVARRGPGMGPR
jgi:hypothetical protein